MKWYVGCADSEKLSVPGPAQNEANEQEELRKLLISNLKGERSLNVKVVKED